MILSKIFKSAPSIEIEGIFTNSLKVTKNSIFVAIVGSLYDGHDYIENAIENGATVIIHSKEVNDKKNGIVYIKTSDVISLMSYISSVFYLNPSQDMNVIAITGTNGKTTTAKIIQQFFNSFSNCGYIGTLGFDALDYKEETELTTPDNIELNRMLAKCHELNVKNCVIEVSSHSLDLRRIEGLNIRYAIFTNFSQDHLDYHKSMESYFSAKLKLFTSLEENDVAIINLDDAKSQDIIKSLNKNVKVITFGKHVNADYKILSIDINFNSTKFDFLYQEKEYHVITNLLSEHNIYNLMAAIISVCDNGHSLDDIIYLCNDIKNIDGRLLKIENDLDLKIIIDYAHTPDSLEKMYQFAKTVVENNGRLISVFGSAGKRDRLKRKILGEISDKYCDYIILTEDDPRTESVLDISKEIQEGIKNTNNIIVEDRYEAIKIAIESANKDDIVLITGKGIENFMYRGNSKELWVGDQIAAQSVIENLKEKNYEN